MPPAGYLTAQGVEHALVHLETTYPALCTRLLLPETSHEGRAIHAVKLAASEVVEPLPTRRSGVLLIAGVHARELVNPDMLVSLALRLCDAYSSGTGLSFGGRSYTARVIAQLLERLDLFLLPLVNPDGRAFVQAPTGDPWWRKNRAPNPGKPCRGVDINRNYGFLHASGIGTSADSCTDIFKGPGAFSEPETRNVRHLLDEFPQIALMTDVHSYSELILYPWGDDVDQTIDPAMNFHNPAYDGLRGNRLDVRYEEYIPRADLDRFQAVGTRVRSAIAAVRGRRYTLEQGILLYPTTGTGPDYAYSRHLVDTGKRKVDGYTIETGREFQPPIEEAQRIIDEVSAGLIEMCRSRLAPLPSPTTAAKPAPGWFGAEDQGADVAAADINGSGRPDLLVFHVDNPGGENHGYYRIGWDMSVGGDIGSWSDVKPIPGWFGAEDQGAGVALGDVNGSGRPDLVVFHLDNPGGDNHGYYRIGWNVDAAGNVSSWSELKPIPGWFGWENQGAGIALHDVNGSGRLDLVVLHIDNPGGENHGYYRIGWDLDASGNARGWSDVKPIPGWFGAETQGAGIALADLNADQRPELVVVHIDNPTGENRGYYRIGWNVDAAGNVGPRWGPVTPIAGWFGAEDQGAGATVADINDNGLADLVIFHVDNPAGENHGYYRIRFDVV